MSGMCCGKRKWVTLCIIGVNSSVTVKTQEVPWFFIFWIKPSPSHHLSMSIRPIPVINWAYPYWSLQNPWGLHLPRKMGGGPGSRSLDGYFLPWFRVVAIYRAIVYPAFTHGGSSSVPQLLSSSRALLLCHTQEMAFLVGLTHIYSQYTSLLAP